ncbi:AP complex, mu/sigma subunit, partial [Melampsora americana]
MIHAVLIFNNEGKPRLTKFYSNLSTTQTRSKTLNSIYTSIKQRSNRLSNFILNPNNPNETIVYRNYATLYFVMIIDLNESELSILDLIQVFVESLDKCFPSVCELDLIFHYDQLQLLLSQIILGGIVLNTSLDSI